MYFIFYQQSRFKKAVLIVSPKFNFRQRKNTHNVKTDIIKKKKKISSWKMWNKGFDIKVFFHIIIYGKKTE